MKCDFSDKLLAWHDANARNLPWRGESDPYRIWISEIMLQQTTTATVAGYYERFLAQFPTVQALADAPQDAVLKAWEGLGYYSRVRNLQAAAKIIAHDRGGQFPRTAKELSKLPGIGPYTAGAIASMAFDEAAPAVDGNLTRVLARVTCEQGCVARADVKARLHDACLRLMDESRPGDFNQALMGLGRLVCLPGKASCDMCPVNEFCMAHKAGRPMDFPVLPEKAAKRTLRRGIALVLCRNKVLVRQRPDTGLLAGLWEFPGFDDAWDADSLTECLLELGIAVQGGKPMGEHRHVFTHLIWDMRGFLFQCSKAPSDAVFVTQSELNQLPMPTAMKHWRALANDILTHPEV